MTTWRQRICAALVTGVALLFGGCSLDGGEDASQSRRRHLFGVGITWSDWLSPSEIPAYWRDTPRAYDQAQLERIARGGATATHGSFDWVDIEPTPGLYDWSRSDERVEDALAEGLTIFAYIGNTPDWARANSNVPGYRSPPAEEFADEFEDFVEAVARRYRGRVERFVFWNEPNGCSWIRDGCSNSDSHAMYTRWLQRAYVALKRGNPDAILAAGALDYHEGVTHGYEYLEGMYEAGAKGFFDAIDIHPYAADGIHVRAIEDTRRVLDQHGDTHVTIWIGEYGWRQSETEAAAERLERVLARLTTESGRAWQTIEYARYLVVTDLPGDNGYGMVARSLGPRPIWDTFERFAGSR